MTLTTQPETSKKIPTPENVLQTYASMHFNLSRERRKDLIETLLRADQASWIYHGLVMIPLLTEQEKSRLVDRLAKSNETSWVYKILSVDRELGGGFLSPDHIDQLRGVFGR